MSMSLFVKKPSEQDLLNIGKHCDVCSQLDFLPFTCEDCSQVLCSTHRTHKCTAKKEFVRPNINTSNLPTANSLFPDRAKDRLKVDAQINRAAPPATIGERAASAVTGLSSNKALDKLNAFLKVKVHENSTLAKLLNIGKTNVSSKPIKVSKTSEILKLKKEAKGDSKVLPADRLYLWCVHIDTKESPRQAVFVSQKWVVGRALDSIADTLKIQNVNNTVQSQEEKLHVFKVEDKVNLLSNSTKCSTLKNNDLIYLVKGTSV